MSLNLQTLISDPDTFGFSVEGDIDASGQSAGLGVRVSHIGDFNGDGHDDLAISAPGLDGFGARQDAGGVFVIYGGSDLADDIADGTFNITRAFGTFGELPGDGFFVQGALEHDQLHGTAAGDVDGDGYDDLFLAAPSFVEIDDPALPFPTYDHRPGTGYIIYGGDSVASLFEPTTNRIDLADLPGGGAGTPAATVINGESDALRLGLAVAGEGDFNGDGYRDIVVGTPQAEGLFYQPDGSVMELPAGIPSPAQFMGRVYTIYGSADRPATIDLAADVVAGDGSTGFMTQGFVETSMVDGSMQADFFGGAIGLFESLAFADLDGDGHDDLLIGASFAGELHNGYDDIEGNEYVSGGVFVIPGAADAPGEIDLSEAIFLEGPATGELLATGFSLANLGDINNDGFEDVAIMAPLMDDGMETNTGAVWGLMGGASLLGAGGLEGRMSLDAVADFRIMGDQAGDAADPALDNIGGVEDTPEDILTSGLAGVGDVNGDGIDDFMVGFAGAHNGAGNAFLVLGREDTTPGETPPLLPFDRLGRFGDSPETGEQDDGILRLVGAPGDNAGYALDGGGDIDGDGIPDIIIGAPSELTASGTFLSDGRVYVLSGSAAAQSEGPTSGPDLLIGTSGADRIDALAGNDTVRGLDGADTLIGAEGDDIIFGGDTAADLRDVIYGGEGNDSIDGGYGNDELRGDAGNDTVTGGSGVDTILGGTGDDVLTGQTWSDVILGGAGADFINGGFGHDRVNGGADADRFYHLGVEGHGSDWIQDFSDAEGDLLVFGGGGASVDDFQVNFTETAGAGAAGVEEAFVIYRPTGQILWALVDGAAQTDIMLSVGGTEYDLLA
ncbi:hypothetical protein [Salipiger abyssi]